MTEKSFNPIQNARGLVAHLERGKLIRQIKSECIDYANNYIEARSDKDRDEIEIEFNEFLLKICEDERQKFRDCYNNQIKAKRKSMLSTPHGINGRAY